MALIDINNRRTKHYSYSYIHVRTFTTSGSAIAEGPREVLVIEILQLQNISLENPIV